MGECETRISIHPDSAQIGLRTHCGRKSIYYGCTVWVNAELESAFTQTVHRSVYGRIAAGNRSITGVLYG